MSFSKWNTAKMMLNTSKRSSSLNQELITLHERGEEFDHHKISVGTVGTFTSRLGSRGTFTGTDISEDDSQYTASVSVQDNVGFHNSSEELLVIESTPSEELLIEKHTLTRLENVSFISVLEDAIYQLGVIQHLLPKANKADDGYYQSLRERYEPLGVRKLMFPNEGPTPIETQLMKVERDRDFISTILKRANEEMLKNLTFYTLAAAIVADHQMKIDDVQLELECATNEKIVKDIKKEMKQITKAVEDSEYNDSVELKNLEGELHDTVVTSEIEKRFTSNWEHSRRSLAKYKTDNAENALMTTLKETQIDIEREYRVNMEIETCINMGKQELEDSIESWMQRYDRESEEKDQELLKLRIDREVNMRNLTELQEKFDLHKQELDEYKAIQEEIRQRLEREALLNKMATRIQAWWRGLMVRRCLGPFKKKKKKKKGKKDKMRAKGSALELIERNQKLKKRQRGKIKMS